LERHGVGFPRIGIAEPRGAALEPAAIDELLSQHSAEALLGELDSLEKRAAQWRAAIVRLRSAISSHSGDNGEEDGAIRPQGAKSARLINAPPCEADDEYWYL
jgi:hypothetical protein